ncbi:hypothetical protein NL676_034388 [Syzygium grande]|nr:hypothetical protein NL676_034388 [Syzygium grande]
MSKEKEKRRPFCDFSRGGRGRFRAGNVGPIGGGGGGGGRRRRGQRSGQPNEDCVKVEGKGLFEVVPKRAAFVDRIFLDPRAQEIPSPQSVAPPLNLHSLPRSRHVSL